jgi:CRP-like cAMP-binding protein
MALVDRDRICWTLKQIPTFSELSGSEYAALAGSCGAARYGAGETIFREGEAGDTLFILLTGSVEIRTARAGRIATLRPLDLFGEVAMVETVRRVATASAAEDATMVLTLTRDALERLQTIEPRAAFLVMRNIAGALAAKLTDTNDLIAPSRAQPNG